MAKINRKKQRRNLLILLCAFLLILGVFVKVVFMIVDTLFVSEQKVGEKQESKKENKLSKEDYTKYVVDELGSVPVMMYHGIHNIPSNETGYVGGNVDVDGYQRTAEAFRQDLQFYYDNGYRMIRLNDYINGNIDVEAGKSPICLTFDDGLENNILVTGTDKEGNINIDPNCAVGILESFKKKYPDFNVTATFFVNGGLFRQPEYNEQIIKWLVENGYDVGNHTYSHVDFTTTDGQIAQQEVGSVYAMLDEIIPGQYVNIVALPFGSPYSYDHEMIPYIQSGLYKGKQYTTQSMLQVAWEADYSPYSNQFNPAFIKRIRAYDNNGQDFDIEMNFTTLETTKYISDGDPNTIVIPANKQDMLGNVYDKNVITY